MLKSPTLRAVVWLCLLGGAAACAPQTVPPTPAAPPTPAPPSAWTAPPEDDDGDVGNACREQVASLADWLREVEAGGQPLALSLLNEGDQLVRREGAAIADPAPLVHLASNTSRLDGATLSGTTAIRDGLSKLITLRRELTPKSPFIATPMLHLAVDAEVPWSRIVDAAQQASAAGIAQVTLVFSDPSRTLPPVPTSPIASDIKRLETATQTRRQQIVAELLAHVYQDCPQGLKVIAQMGAHEVADFKQLLLDELPSAMAACSCAPDANSVKALHWAIFGTPRSVSGYRFALAGPDDKTAPAIAFGAAQRWDEASAELLDKLDPDTAVQLVIRSDPEAPKD